VDTSNNGFAVKSGDFIGWTSEMDDQLLISYDKLSTDQSPNGLPSYYYKIPVGKTGPEFPVLNDAVSFDKADYTIIFSLAVAIIRIGKVSSLNFCLRVRLATDKVQFEKIRFFCVDYLEVSLNTFIHCYRMVDT
jgi:hypothetical protein